MRPGAALDWTELPINHSSPLSLAAGVRKGKGKGKGKERGMPEPVYINVYDMVIGRLIEVQKRNPSQLSHFAISMSPLLLLPLLMLMLVYAACYALLLSLSLSLPLLLTRLSTTSTHTQWDWGYFIHQLKFTEEVIIIIFILCRREQERTGILTLRCAACLLARW